MSYPLGSPLIGEWDWYKNGVLFDPSPLPTITLAYKGDGTTIVAPALTRVATGRFRAIVFSAADTALVTGEYAAFATTSDATADFQVSVATWQVGIVTPASITGTGASIALVSPVLASGVLALVQADDYDPADGASRAITFNLSNTDLNLAGASVSIEMKDFASVGVITGVAPNYIFTFTLTSAQTALFIAGRSLYQIRIILANAHRVTFSQDDVNVTRLIGT
jgi:hypothetical protein